MASWNDRRVLQNIFVQLRRLNSLTAPMNVMPGGRGIVLNGDLLVEGDVSSNNLPPYAGGVHLDRVVSQSSDIESSLFDSSYAYAIMIVKHGTISLNGSDLSTNTSYYFDDLTVSGFDATTAYELEIFYFEKAPIEPPLPTEEIQITTTETTSITAGGEESETITADLTIPTEATSATISLSSVAAPSGLSVSIKINNSSIYEANPIELSDDALSSPLSVAITMNNETESEISIDDDSRVVISLVVAYSR